MSPAAWSRLLYEEYAKCVIRFVAKYIYKIIYSLALQPFCHQFFSLHFVGNKGRKKWQLPKARMPANEECPSLHTIST